MTAATVNAYAQARALANDPQSTWGPIPAEQVHRLKKLLRGLVDEIDWLRLANAVDMDTGAILNLEQVRRNWAREAARADDFEHRLDLIREAHTCLPDPDAGYVCGVCAAAWPCPTVRVATGGAA